MVNTVYKVEGMHCASCALNIEHIVSKLDSVKDVKVSYASNKLFVSSDKVIGELEINKLISPLGYKIINDSEVNNDLTRLRIKLFAVIPALTIALALMIAETALSIMVPYSKYILFLLATITLGIGGKGFLLAVVNLIRFRVANMDTLIGIGTVSAYIYSTIVLILQRADHTYFDTTIVVIGFVIAGKYLEGLTKNKTNSALNKLLSLTPQRVTIKRDNMWIERSINELTIDEIVLVKSGERIPADGLIINGDAVIDESMITGESIPVDKLVGDKVIAGTVNIKDSFEFKTTQVGSNTLLSQIINLVEKAQISRAPIQKLADKVSAVFVPLVLVLALLTLIGWVIAGRSELGLINMVSVLVIACPCALGLATPTAIIMGTGQGARRGIVFKSAQQLELLSQTKTIIFDKTGTLTEGNPKVTKVICTDMEESEFIGIVASIETYSQHPIAKAILKYAQEKSLKLVTTGKVVSHTGFGLEANIGADKYLIGSEVFIKNLGISINIEDTSASDVGTKVIVVKNKKVIGHLVIKDTLKPAAINTVTKLKSLGYKITMLTGDSEAAAKELAQSLNIEYKSRVTPEQKSNLVGDIRKGGKVLMIGDGINDAPALALADVSIAMGTGTDIAIEAAGITILNGDLAKVVTAIEISRKTLASVKQNLFWAFIYNIIGVPLAALGLLNPGIAALAMAVSSLSVMLNSLRLKLIKFA